VKPQTSAVALVIGMELHATNVPKDGKRSAALHQYAKLVAIMDHVQFQELVIATLTGLVIFAISVLKDGLGLTALLQSVFLDVRMAHVSELQGHVNVSRNSMEHIATLA
jgi:hypothetical protein